MDMEKTGTYLASLRRGRDMTQQQVADILGVSNKTVSKWESGAGLPDHCRAAGAGGAVRRDGGRHPGR